MNVRLLKYTIAFLLPLICFWSLTSQGYLTFAAVFTFYLFVPFVELFFPSDLDNIDQVEESIVLEDSWYDYLLYLMVPIQYGLLLLFLIQMAFYQQTTIELIGKTLAMGISCGAVGINVAHELGHRKNAFERVLAKCLLLSSMYMHFIIEHNMGHHKHVSTKEDPSSARKWEPVFLFWIRSIVMTNISAWKIEKKRLHKNGHSFLSFQNEMIRFQLIQIAFLVLIYFVFGGFALLCFLVAACIGILQLETQCH